MIYGYIGKSTNEDVSADILSKLGKIDLPVYPTGTFENTFVADSGPSTSYKEDLIKEYKNKEFSKGFQYCKSERFNTVESWENIETTAIASNNSLFLARGNKEQLYVLDLREQLNQVWVFTAEFKDAFSQFTDMTTLIFPDYHMWKLNNWHFKKYKINFLTY